MMKGENNSVWKNHNTEDYKSKRYYKKKMAGSSGNSDPYNKRSRKGDYKKAYAIKRSTIGKEVKILQDA